MCVAVFIHSLASLFITESASSLPVFRNAVTDSDATEWTSQRRAVRVGTDWRTEKAATQRMSRAAAVSLPVPHRTQHNLPNGN